MAARKLKVNSTLCALTYLARVVVKRNGMEVQQTDTSCVIISGLVVVLISRGK